MVAYGALRMTVNVKNITLEVLKEINPLNLVMKAFYLKNGSMVLDGIIQVKEKEHQFTYLM